jgi:RimJ/RimL family protein N-acetyltransferase
MRAVYLTGEDFYLRAMILEDKDHATNWFKPPFPIDAVAAEAILKEAHAKGWDEPDVLFLAVVRASDDEIIGGVAIEDQARRTAYLNIYSAPSLDDGESWRARVLELVIPWLRDELEILVTRVEIPEDEKTMLASAERLGMIPAIRLRQAQARPGHRVDILGYQALNPKISVGEIDA